ncbi:di-heme-cytochrome C peroxidase [Ruegeria atlantica]|uniref:di-heme-cytochrome C peroxidase n=1 Tax=Ruegeria atlantica TaxID=81569 RepID=UPI0020C4E909|nr:di-heme-cytochrome C peroxidase [Ruegeria atlantica]
MSLFWGLFLLLLRNISFLLVTCLVFGSSALAQIVYTDQGPDWTPAHRTDFYSRDQGSRIMPLAWMRALRQPNGTGFLDGALARYGYLNNPDGPEQDVPVGFTIADFQGEPSIGMTCAACHTRQVNVNGTPFRIDGGPGMVDFQAFLSDLGTAVGNVLESDAAFDEFSKRVGGTNISDIDKRELKLAVDLWHLRFDTLIDRSLPNTPWGPGRLDAVSMIFNRLTGLDIGEPPTYLIPENIYPADAPTRYPFLWNAARQDQTQWPGFADNGNDLLGLARNLGEVYGVFGVLHPSKNAGFAILNRDYLGNNSANFEGLQDLEDLIWKIGPPQWPWQLDQALIEEGQGIFERPSGAGGCIECHGIRPGKNRWTIRGTWATPVQDVGTDNRQCQILERKVVTGVMEGAKVPFLTDPVLLEDTSFNVLATAVVGTIFQRITSLGRAEDISMSGGEVKVLPPELEQLKGAFRNIETTVPGVAAATNTSGCAYEARVLEGIWASAPYLHNGSVPTLEALLLPVSERPASFKLGPDYDIQAVGLAVEQSEFDHTLETTDCSDVSSGNSRCGHEYGSGLSAEERRALLEYLKSL